MTATADVRSFARSMRGRVIDPSDPDYDEARRLWNGMIDRRPSVIARCSGTADVIAALDFARNHEVAVTGRSLQFAVRECVVEASRSKEGADP